MKTLCFSDNVIDYYQNTSEMFPGGNAVNVAVHLAKQQVDSHYLGHFGDDAMGQVIIKALKEHGVIFDHSKVVKNSTTKHCIYSIKDGERTFVKVELGKNWQGRFPLDEQLLDYMNEFDVIISSCNSKMEDEMRKIGQLKPIFVYDFGEKEK